MHSSVKLDTPVEFINLKPINPLISKCQIKVCYVDDKPNRNRSVITKDVAREMANSLPGSPIVGFFNDASQDFEEHNRIIDISNGKFDVKDTTRPYGFVDLGAKVWFQKFLDDGLIEREYLVTEGYLWTGQYPECNRVITEGNNQSMELDEKTLDAYWTKDNNGKPQFYIINEAIIKKLCILGEECEPCFEGSNITAPVEFSFDDDFKTQLFSMMKEIKEILNEGGKKVFNQYAVEIGDKLWDAIYSHINQAYPDPECKYCSIYRVDGIFEEGSQKFAILQHHTDMKYYRLNFSISDDAGFVADGDLTEVTKTYTPASEPQFALDQVEEYEANFAKKQGKKDEDDNNKNDNKTEEPKSDDNKKSDEGSKKDDDKKEDPAKKDDSSKSDPKSDDEDEDKKKKKKEYSLDDIVEYQELKAQYDTLQNNYSALEQEKASLESQINELKTFKLSSERKQKEEMINSFYMLDEEDKKDVLTNIDTYSLEDIEAKLSVICVRKRVNFNSDDDNKDNDPTVYNLNNAENHNDDVPDWVKAVLDTAKNMN